MGARAAAAVHGSPHGFPRRSRTPCGPLPRPGAAAAPPAVLRPAAAARRDRYGAAGERRVQRDRSLHGAGCRGAGARAAALAARPGQPARLAPLPALPLMLLEQRRRGCVQLVAVEVAISCWNCVHTFGHWGAQQLHCLTRDVSC